MTKPDSLAEYHRLLRTPGSEQCELLLAYVKDGYSDSLIEHKLGIEQGWLRDALEAASEWDSPHHAWYFDLLAVRDRTIGRIGRINSRLLDIIEDVVAGGTPDKDEVAAIRGLVTSVKELRLMGINPNHERAAVGMRDYKSIAKQGVVSDVDGSGKGLVQTTFDWHIPSNEDRDEVAKDVAEFADTYEPLAE